MLTATAGMIADFLQAHVQNGESEAARGKLLSQCQTSTSFHGTHTQVPEEGLSVWESVIKAGQWIAEAGL